MKKKSLRELAATTKAPPPLEKNIVKRTLDWLNSLPQARFRKKHGGRTRSGEADIHGCIQGLHFELEAKRPGNEATKRQDANLTEWENAGAAVGVFTSLEECKAIVEKAFFLRGLNLYEPPPVTRVYGEIEQASKRPHKW